VIRKFLNARNVLGFLIILFLSYTILIPLGKMVIDTFISKLGEAESTAKPGSFTLDYWLTVWNSSISKVMFYKPLWNTITIGIGVSAIGLTTGAIIAWLITRTDIPFKKTFGFLLIIPYMFPSWFKASVWLTVFKNERVGGTQGLFAYLFNIDPPNWLAYGFIPIVLVMAFHYYIFSYLLVGATLSTMSSSLEEQANILGASRFKTLRKITFPLVLPAILSAFILIVAKAIGSFGVPAFLGLPTKYYTMSTMIYNNFKSSSETIGYVLSILLIILAIIILYLNQKMIKSKNYETIGGKDSRGKLILLGKWKKLTTFLLSLFVFIVTIFPVVILIWQTLMLKNGDYGLDNLTLHYWIGNSDPNIANGAAGVLKSGKVFSALKNSLTLSFSAAIIESYMKLLIEYVVTRGNPNILTKYIDQLSFIPYLFPSIALSAIFLSTFAVGSTFVPALYGSLALLILITVVRELPFATRAGTSTMVQIGGELEEAAKIAGASWIRRFFKIMLPLSKKGLLAGFIIVFISAMKELDLIIMLVSPSTATLTTLTFDLEDQDFLQSASAIITIIIFSIMVIYILTTSIGKTDISRGIGGK